MPDLLYKEHTNHGPEVDFGCGWSRDGTPGYRVTWVADWDDTSWTHRGNVVAVRGDETHTLAVDLPLFVVEFLLSESYWTVGIRRYDDTGWATACSERADVSWVTRRLARWQGCQLASYTGGDHAGGEVKATKAYAALNGYTGREGGWIYAPTGRPVVQGWRSFARLLINTNRIKPLRTEEIRDFTAPVGKQLTHSETWVVADKAKSREVSVFG